MIIAGGARGAREVPGGASTGAQRLGGKGKFLSIVQRAGTPVTRTAKKKFCLATVRPIHPTDSIAHRKLEPRLTQVRGAG